MQIKELGTLATKAELKIEQDKMTKLQTFDSSHFRGKINFEDNDTQNYLVFQPMYRHSKKIGSSHYLSAWESKGLSNKSNNPPAKSDDSLAPSLIILVIKQEQNLVEVVQNKKKSHLLM